MTEQVVTVLPCPFCGAGEPTIAVRLRAARGVVYGMKWLSEDGSSHPAVAFDGAGSGPCGSAVARGAGRG